MSRRRIVVALWAVAVALAVTLVLGSGRLWGKKSTADSPVAAYIKSVDAVQQHMRLPLTQLLTAYRNFASITSKPSEQTKLVAAVRTLRTLETRLSALPAPPAAAKLRRLLTKLVRAEAGVAAEIAQLGRFMPRFRSTIAATTIANRQLARALAGAKLPKSHTVRGTRKQIAAAKAAYKAAANKVANAQADAVDAYDQVLGRAVRALRALQPPPVMAPAYRTQIKTFEATERAGAALANELRGPHRAAVPVLSRKFTVASRLALAVSAQKAEIAAVKAYNARVRGLGNVNGAVQQETSRLQRLYG